jgi:hypothetical protein
VRTAGIEQGPSIQLGAKLTQQHRRHGRFIAAPLLAAASIMMLAGSCSASKTGSGTGRVVGHILLCGGPLPKSGRPRCYVQGGRIEVLHSGTRVLQKVSDGRFDIRLRRGVYTLVARQHKNTYHLVGRPIAVIVSTPFRGQRGFEYWVFIRLNRPVPRDANGSTLGEAALDGAGGGGGLYVSTAHLRRGRYCYAQLVENDFAYSRTLKHPHPGAKVTLEVHIQRRTNRARHVAVIRRRISLQRRRASVEGDYYPRRQGCLGPGRG